MEQTKNTPAPATNNTPAPQQQSSLNDLLKQDNIKKRFEEIMGERSASFISSIVSATKSTPKLLECNPNSIIQSAVLAATLNLPIQSNLGFAYIVPYKGQAQFQMGYKGYIQLALRTNQYKNINATVIYEGELIKHDRITGEVIIDQSKAISKKIVGYCAYFKLISGFEKYLYLPKEDVEEHGKKYSQSYSSQFGRWQLDFDAMALKTVIKMLLSKYGILSVEMQKAVIGDQAVINNADNMDLEYSDSTTTEEAKYEDLGNKADGILGNETLFNSETTIPAPEQTNSKKK